MPLEELEKMVLERAGRVQVALDDKFKRLAAESTNPPAPSDALGPTPGATMPPPLNSPGVAPTEDEEGPTIPPDTVRAATAALVEAGMLAAATDTITPDVMKALNDAADRVSPGLYDLTNADDLAEFVRSLANGTTSLERPDDAGAGGGLPGAGGPGAGGPGAGGLGAALGAALGGAGAGAGGPAGL